MKQESNGRWFLDSSGDQATVPSDPSIPLTLQPDYSNRRFDTPQTVYCAERLRRYLSGANDLQTLHYNYQDRLQENDADKWSKSVDAANTSGKQKHSAQWLSVLLSTYHNKQCIAEHVIAGINRSNGHWWWAVGWREEQP